MSSECWCSSVVFCDIGESSWIVPVEKQKQWILSFPHWKKSSSQAGKPWMQREENRRLLFLSCLASLLNRTIWQRAGSRHCLLWGRGTKSVTSKSKPGVGDVEEPEVVFLLCVCEIAPQSQEFNCWQGCFPEGSVDGGRRKINGRSGLFLPSSSKHELGETLAVPSEGHFALSHTSCCSMAAAALSLGDISEPLSNSQGMTDPTWITIPVGDTLCHHWQFMDGGKKRLLQSSAVPEYWTLNFAQTWGTVAEMHWAPHWLQLQHKFCEMSGI